MRNGGRRQPSASGKSGNKANIAQSNSLKAESTIDLSSAASLGPEDGAN